MKSFDTGMTYGKAEPIPCSYEGIEVGDLVIYTTCGAGRAKTGVGIYRGLYNDKAAIDVQTTKNFLVHKETREEYVPAPWPNVRFNSKAHDDAWREWHVQDGIARIHYENEERPYEYRTYLQNNVMTKLDDVINNKRM